MAGHVDLFVDERRKRRRQKGQKGRSPIRSDQDRNPLEIVGYSCTIFSDDVLAAYLDTEESLLPWTGDPQLRIDRYDARHLLSDVSNIRKGQAEVRRFQEENEDDEELDRERYFDLENAPGTAEYLEELEEEDRKRQKVDGAAYKSVGFSYGEAADPALDHAASAATPAPPSTDTESFQPPYAVPSELLDKMPASQKHHQVMLHTAKFVHTHGGQTEIILRVKQGSNPTFSFLMPEDPLHPFFRFMVEDYERLAQAMQSKPQGERLESKERDAVSLVAAAYGEDDEDESEGEDGAEPSGAGGQGARPSAEGGRETQPSGGGEKAVQDSAEGDEQQRQRKNGTGDSDGAAEGMDLPVGGQEAERLEERSVGIEDGGASAGEGVKEGSSEREAAVQSKPSGGVEETNPPLSEAPDNSDVQVEASDDPAEQVSPEVGEKAKAGPSLVNFAIAKNPPLAAVRKAKRETSAGGSEKDPDAGSVADRKRSELLEDSVVDQPLESEGKFTLASGENLFHAAGVNEPLAISLNGVSPSRVNEPLSVGVNKPLPVGVNEPPLQTKRVIEKMVEFIARNGKHFEAVVRKKDEQERRFPFLAPWDPYHGYYASLLEELLKKKGLETDEPTVERQPGPGASLLDSAAETIAPTAIAATSETDRGASSRAGIDPLESDEDGSEDDKQTQPLFFGETEEEDGLAQSGRPAGLGSDAVRAAVLAATRTGSFGSHTELKGLENRVKKRAASPLAGDGQEMEAAKRSKPAGLGIDAVRAAVMQATRTPSPSVSANLVADGPSEVKPSGLGMDAVRAAVIKATRGKANPDQDKLQERAELVDRTEPEPVLPSDANEGRLHAIRKDASTLGGSALAGRTSAGLTSSQNHETLSEKAAIEAARAAAAAAAGEADSSDARLTAFEKKRAERLKRAKMFAAMLGGGAGAASGSVGGSGAGGPGNSVSGTIGGAARDGSAGVSGDVRPDVEGSAQAGRKMAEADQVEEIVEMGGAKAILRSPKEEGELVEEGEERERVAGGDADEGERKERRQKWERRHREDDDTGREETREERRRRRKERRERKAREEDVRNGTAAESGGSGRAETEKDNEREERRRRKRHRERREWEESPEEGEIRGEESSDRGTERYRSRPEEEERFGRSREGIEKRDKSMRESERPRETGRMSEERRERKRERSRERRDKGDRATRKMGTGSAELDTAGVVSGKRAGSERSGRHTRHGRVNEVATGLLAKQEVEGKVHGGETESSSMRGVKNGAESQIDVPESVRAKVRAMLGY